MNNNGNNMHIARSGKKAGSWVLCQAQIQCTIGGTHTSKETIQKVKQFKGYSSVASVTEKDYVAYLKDSVSKSIPYTPPPVPAPRSRAEKAARLKAGDEKYARSVEAKAEQAKQRKEDLVVASGVRATTEDVTNYVKKLGQGSYSDGVSELYKKLDSDHGVHPSPIGVIKYDHASMPDIQDRGISKVKLKFTMNGRHVSIQGKSDSRSWSTEWSKPMIEDPVPRSW